MKSVSHLLIAALLSLFLLQASNAQLSGIVKNAVNLEPIFEVNILVIGSSTGTSTNSDGEFSLKISSFPANLQLSALGFESREIEVFDTDTSVVFYLKPTRLSMEEVVIVPDRTINPLTNSSPIARSTVSLEQLTSKAVTSAVELLRAETGVFVQQTSVGQGSLYIRGRAGRDVLYLFNGFRMNPSFIRSGQNQYFGAVDPFLINKLDVYRGPVSVYYGSDALSGGVNISPIIKDFSDSNTLSGKAMTFLNFEGNGEKTLHGNLAYQSSGFSLFAGGTYRDFDYYNMSSKSDETLWFPYNETLSNADYRFKSFQTSSKIKTSEYSNLSLVSYYGEIPDAPRLDRITLGFATENVSSTISPENAYYSNTSPLIFWGNTAEYRITTPHPVFQTVGVKAGYFRLKDFRKEQDFAFNSAPEFSILDSERTYWFDVSDTTDFDQSASNQVQASIDVRTNLQENLYLKWGGDFSIDRVTSRRHSSAGEEILPRYPDGSEYILSGIFAQLDHGVSEQLNMEYGLRYSHTFANIPFEGVDTDRKFNPYSDHYGQVTGAVSMSYTYSKELTLVSNISSGFRAPNISDLSEIGTRRSSQFQSPNTDLSPEKTRNIDFGMQYYDGEFSSEFFVFWLHYFDKITRVETGNFVDEFGQVQDPSTSTDLYTEVTNQNVNSMDLFGIEFRGDYSINSYVKSGLTFTYTWGKLKNETGVNEPADRIPPANGLFFIDYTASKSLTIRPQARYAFAHRRISPDEISDIRVSENGTDGFVNIQLLINLETTENISLKFVADNLMDAAYREHASSLDGMGRNYTVSVSYSF